MLYGRVIRNAGFMLQPEIGRPSLLCQRPAQTSHPTPYNPYTLQTLRPPTYPLHPTGGRRGHENATRPGGYRSLDPKPYTLHPTPYNLHPTPQTLHPTGGRRAHEPRRAGGGVFKSHFSGDMVLKSHLLPVKRLQERAWNTLPKRLEWNAPLGPDRKHLPLGPCRKRPPLGPDRKYFLLGPDRKHLPLGPDRKHLPLGPCRKRTPLG
ncbi:hypothetical protein T484DRAFT_3209990 [Baffinella frigidus]|nr:hypothetical protein T484DRAFT_3209990 [Cryptophyta sp. CCMP2293]